MTDFLKTERAQRVAIWIWWALVTLSGLILLFTGLQDGWDAILLRVSTGAGMVAAAIARLLPAALRGTIVGMASKGIEGDSQEVRDVGVQPNE